MKGNSRQSWRWRGVATLTLVLVAVACGESAQVKSAPQQAAATSVIPVATASVKVVELNDLYPYGLQVDALLSKVEQGWVRECMMAHGLPYDAVPLNAASSGSGRFGVMLPDVATARRSGLRAGDSGALSPQAAANDDRARNNKGWSAALDNDDPASPGCVQTVVAQLQARVGLHARASYQSIAAEVLPLVDLTDSDPRVAAKQREMETCLSNAGISKSRFTNALSESRSASRSSTGPSQEESDVAVGRAQCDVQVGMSTSMVEARRSVFDSWLANHQAAVAELQATTQNEGQAIRGLALSLGIAG